MRIMDRLNNYLNDREYRIIVKENEVNIINYDEIIDFSLTIISVKYRNRIIIVEGSELVISKMVQDEVKINGNVSSIRIN